MMHQPVENLVGTIVAFAESLDIVQAGLLLRHLGGWDQDLFTVKGTAYNTSLKGLLKSSDCLLSLANIKVIFAGGPTLQERHEGTLVTFVADRLLVAIRTHGMDYVVRKINEVIKWKDDDDNEKSDEWSDLAAAERYCG